PHVRFDEGAVETDRWLARPGYSPERGETIRGRRAWSTPRHCPTLQLRNLARKAPKHALAELREDFHRIVYAVRADSARAAHSAFERKWHTRCPGVARSLAEGSDDLVSFLSFPKAQGKTLRTTNAIERLNEEFRRRVKTQGSLPTEDAAVSLLFGLVASGQIKLRKIDGGRTIASVLSRRTAAAA
ncbi:MAG TPA: transposase, partial [Methylomirabilota bacterium]|nr:transposase [Methylomirabilota bacterium]